MSVHALAWVFDLPAGSATSTERLVLLALADHAGRDGEDIYPTTKRLCRMTGLSERTVRATRKALEDRGLLVPTGEWHPTGRPDRSRTRYALPIAEPPNGVQELPPERGAALAPRQQMQGERGAGAAAEPTTTTKPTTSTDVEPTAQLHPFARARARLGRHRGSARQPPPDQVPEEIVPSRTLRRGLNLREWSRESVGSVAGERGAV